MGGVRTACSQGPAVLALFFKQSQLSASKRLDVLVEHAPTIAACCHLCCSYHQSVVWEVESSSGCTACGAALAEVQAFDSRLLTAVCSKVGLHGSKTIHATPRASDLQDSYIITCFACVDCLRMGS
jgi:hypothetical protein